ncbi:ABC transporter permease [Ornithinibacillus sp. 4-3]|uniref:ABC transporter permease n=1 Tax=Ornithinibacillus sp. 4-3 TaxID=3231488 RepID=A0AB39HMT8_9BACI
MFSYILKRTLFSLATIFLVLVFVFVAARVTGNPAEIMYPDGMEPGQLEQYNEKYGLDKSYPEQFYSYMKNAFRGDFGQSIVERRPVTDVIIPRLGETLKLGSIALVTSIVVGILLGIFIALNRGNIIAKAINNFMSLIYAVPGFIIAIFLMLLFSFQLNILPSQGGGSVLNYIMPVICLSVGPIVSIAKHVRTGVLDTLNQEYIRTAVAKGIGRKRVIYGHAFRNALIPTLTITGMVFVDIMAGSMIIETVFSWPGIGMTLINSVLNRDFPIIQFSIVLISAVVVVVNYVLDVLYMIVDPRIGKGGNA